MLRLGRWLIVAGLAAGCAKAQETPLLEATSSDAWRVAITTRTGPLRVGTNQFVVAIQDPTLLWVAPGQVILKMTMSPSMSDSTTVAQVVNLQPDGEPGHFLAIVDLPTSDRWQSHLAINYKTVDYGVDFELQN